MRVHIHRFSFATRIFFLHIEFLSPTSAELVDPCGGFTCKVCEDIVEARLFIKIRNGGSSLRPLFGYSGSLVETFANLTHCPKPNPKLEKSCIDERCVDNARNSDFFSGIIPKNKFDPTEDPVTEVYLGDVEFLCGSVCLSFI